MTNPARRVRRGGVRIGVTLGDANGVGPELALAAVQAVRMGREPGLSLMLIGSAEVLGRQACAVGVARPPCRAVCPPRAAAIPVVTAWDPAPHRTPPPCPGRATAEAAVAACAWIEAGIDACLDGRLDALVTGPICKEGLRLAGLSAPGHTEILAERTGAPRFAMMLLGGPLRVVLATRHLPLRDVPAAVTREAVYEAVRLAAESLPWLGLPNGRIGVCGLNPHAGDGGALGDEERTVIGPALQEAGRDGFPAVGPLAGDAAFHRAARGEFDVLIAMYHDQGLAPLKLVGFETGVNLTLGLPIVRTSPAHGTAFDLAGRGLASPSSTLSALRLAARLAARPNPWRPPRE